APQKGDRRMTSSGAAATTPAATSTSASSAAATNPAVTSTSSSSASARGAAAGGASGASTRLVLVGGGPRAIGVLERLAANAAGPEHAAHLADAPLHVDIVDPHMP